MGCLNLRPTLHILHCSARSLTQRSLSLSLSFFCIHSHRSLTLTHSLSYYLSHTLSMSPSFTKTLSLYLAFDFLHPFFLSLLQTNLFLSFHSLSHSVYNSLAPSLSHSFSLWFNHTHSLWLSSHNLSGSLCVPLTQYYLLNVSRKTRAIY